MPVWSSTSCRIVCAIALALPMCGCGGNQYEVVPVKGTVFCDGAAAVGAVLVFEPIDDPGSTGRVKGEPGVTSRGVVDADGSVILMTDPRGSRGSIEGALTGPHRVTLMPPRTTPAVMAAEDRSLPADEQEQIKAELAKIPVFEPLGCGTIVTPAKVEVVSGSNEFFFELSGDPPKNPTDISMSGGSD